MNRSVDLCVVVTPPTHESFEHLGVSYLRAVLGQHGMASRIHIVQPVEIDSFPDSLASSNPLLLGFYLFGGNWEPSRRLMVRMRERFPQAHITLGGPATLRAADELLALHSEADSVVVGEGEHTLLELVRRLSEGRDLEGCLGLTYRAPSGEILRNAPRPLIRDLDSLPFADRSIFEHHPAPYMRIITNRGCHASCTFCEEGLRSQQAGPMVRFRSAQNVMRELQYLHDQYGVRKFDFCDSTFLEYGDPIGVKKVEDLIDLIRESGLRLRLSVTLRAESISRHERTRELLPELIDVGVESLFIGLEAGNDPDLKLHGKRARVADNDFAVEFVQRLPVTLRFGFITFNPYSTHETVAENFAFLHRHRLGYSMSPFVSDLEVYPAVAIRRKLVRDGLIRPEAGRFSAPRDYAYQDPRIGELFSSLSRFRPPEEEEGLWVKVELMRNRIRRAPETLGSEPVAAAVAAIEQFQRERNERNYTLAMECLEASSRGAAPSELEQIGDAANFAAHRVRLRQLHWSLLLSYGRTDRGQDHLGISAPRKPRNAQ